jgi:predicted nucleic acid-binding protein
MTPVFADTFFFLALINPRDAAHARAVAVVSGRTGPLLTTAWVLTEVADGLAATADRHLVQRILADLDQEPRDIVVPASPDLFDRGLRLYLARPDKSGP